MKNYLNLRDLIVILISVAFITVFFIATNIFAQTPGVDVTFNPLLTKDVTENYTGNFALQPDGKILIYGAFQNSGTYLKRLNTDGTTDTSFNCALCNTITVFNAIVQPDGKILVAGLSSGAAIYRLNPDGSQDLTFNGTLPVAGSPFSNDVEAVAVQPDGKIIVRHTFSTGGFTEWDILRLNADGSIDGSFTKIALGGRLINTDYSRVALLPDGKIMTAGATISATSEPFLRRYNSNGTTDTTFETPAFNDGRRINYFDFYPDGSIIISGFFSGVNSVPRRDLVKLLPVGNVDLNFNGSAIFNTFNKHAGKVSVLPDGKVLVNTIDYNSLNPTNTNNRLYRLNPDGSIDTTFNVPADLTTAHNWTVDSSNRILVFGVFSGILKYLRLNADGSLDSSFNSPTLTKPGTVKALAVLTDGKILVSGDFNRVGGVIKNNIARLNADGTLDNSFDSGSGFNVAPVSIAIQTDGKILAAGSFTTYNGVSRSGAARLNSDGSLDNSFNVTAAQVNTIVALPSGKILIGGDFAAVNGVNQRALARLNADGGLDASFNTTFGSGGVRTLAVQADGKIMVGGGFSGVNGFNRQNLVRLNSDGSLDTTFNAGSVGNIKKVILQTDGKYLLLQSESTILRRNNDGSADTSFQTPNINGTVNTIFLQSDGRILAGGDFYSPRSRIARFSSNGALDTVFLQMGANAPVNAFAAQSDEKVIVGGDFTLIDNRVRSGIAGITSTAVQPKTIFDFDGDGKADISVFRPSENRWYVLRSTDFGVTQQVFAVSGDVPVPADYDGDGKTDFAIFRPSSGDWWSLSSINNQQIYAHWGENGIIARPSDFDGDGKSDYIFFLTANSTWYRYGSTVGASYVTFGLFGDKPVTGDFDGDGKSDVAIYRPSTGDWWWQSSIDNIQRATHWGISTDIPVPADYDGDKRTDFAVYRPSEGAWYIFNSAGASPTIINFGIAEDKPVPADYDGDGKADIAVFRPSTGVWYLMKSTAGFTALQFGISTDIPAPNAFVP